MMDWGSAGWGAGEWIAMSALMIVFWGGLLALGVWAVGRLRLERRQGPGDRADALLDERFARGEIDGDELTRSRELLHASGPRPTHSGR